MLWKRKKERGSLTSQIYRCALRDHMDAISLPRNGKVSEGKTTQSLEETLSEWTRRRGASSTLGNWFPEWAVGIYFCNSSLTMSFTRYTIFTFKMYSAVLFVFFQTCATISTVNFRAFHDLEEKPACQLSFSQAPPLRSQQTTFCLHGFHHKM